MDAGITYAPSFLPPSLPPSLFPLFCYYTAPTSSLSPLMLPLHHPLFIVPSPLFLPPLPSVLPTLHSFYLPLLFVLLTLHSPHSPKPSSPLHDASITLHSPSQREVRAQSGVGEWTFLQQERQFHARLHHLQHYRR